MLYQLVIAKASGRWSVAGYCELSISRHRAGHPELFGAAEVVKASQKSWIDGLPPSFIDACLLPSTSRSLHCVARDGNFASVS